MAEQDYEVVDGEATDVVTGEIVKVESSAALSAIERAQIDIQIATAKQYPRSIQRFQTEAMALACADAEVAESMFYSLPRGKGRDRKFITGPSVRFAEVVQYSWGNIRSDARVIAIEDDYIVAQGSCIDLEKNIGSRIEVRRRITDSRGRRYNEDMITVTGNAACSIALRNAIFDVIPFALAKKVYDAAVKMATGGGQPIEARRANALAWFARAGAHEDRVLQLLGVETAADINEEHLTTLIGLRNAIKNNETTIDAAFSTGGREDKSAESQAAEERLDAAAAEAERAKSEAKSAPAEPAKAEEPKEEAKPKAAAKKAAPAEAAPAETQQQPTLDMP